MPRGYRLLIIAACGITLFLALGFGAYFGSLYSPGHKQYQTIAAQKGRQNDYTGPSQSLPDISGLPGPVERAIANPHPATGDDNEKRDLAAQEASALWAFWMVVASFASVVITAVGTIFLYKQIVLTREAVEDTGNATKAMERQNRLAESAQRPWIKISVEVDSITRNENQIYIKSRTTFTNIGKTAARNFHSRMRVGMHSKEWDGVISPTFDEWSNWPIKTDKVLLPGEALTIESNISGDPSKIVWNEQGFGRGVTHGLIIAGGFYTADGDGEQLWTLRAYVVTHDAKRALRPMGILRGQYGKVPDDEVHLDITRDRTR